MKAVAIVLSLTLPALAVAAQAPAPASDAAPAARKASPPPPAAPKGFQLPTPTRFTLPNGMKATLVQWGNTPKVTIELAISAGNAHETAEQVWLSDLVADLMREGTTTRTGTRISEEAARMGGALEITVAADTTEIATDVLSEFGPEAVALVADVARNPKLPESELARLKADKLRELSIAKSTPQQLALEKFRSVLYAGHAYGRLFPAESALQGYTIAQARDFYARNFGAARAHIYVAGRFTPAEMEKAIRDAFAGWAAGPAPARTQPAPRSVRGVHLVDRPDAVQSTLIVGMPVIDPSQPDYVPLVVTNTLLGGYFSSRMTSNLREQKGYTYSPFSQLSSRQRDTYWAQNADVTTAVTGPSLKEIFFEIDRLQSEPPTAEELQSVKNYAAGTFVLLNSTRGGIINQLQFVDLHGLPETYLRDYVSKVNAVTPATVQQMAQRYISDDKATIVVVGDRKTVEEQIKPYGPIS
jgi:predicted Zn-dependent peptidase